MRFTFGEVILQTLAQEERRRLEEAGMAEQKRATLAREGLEARELANREAQAAEQARHNKEVEAQAAAEVEANRPLREAELRLRELQGNVSKKEAARMDAEMAPMAPVDLWRDPAMHALFADPTKKMPLSELMKVVGASIQYEPIKQLRDARSKGMEGLAAARDVWREFRSIPKVGETSYPPQEFVSGMYGTLPGSDLVGSAAAALGILKAQPVALGQSDLGNLKKKMDVLEAYHEKTGTLELMLPQLNAVGSEIERIRKRISEERLPAMGALGKQAKQLEERYLELLDIAQGGAAVRGMYSEYTEAGKARGKSAGLEDK